MVAGDMSKEVQAAQHQIGVTAQHQIGVTVQHQIGITGDNKEATPHLPERYS